MFLVLCSLWISLSGTEDQFSGSQDWNVRKHPVSSLNDTSNQNPTLGLSLKATSLGSQRLQLIWIADYVENELMRPIFRLSNVFLVQMRFTWNVVVWET